MTGLSLLCLPMVTRKSEMPMNLLYSLSPELASSKRLLGHQEALFHLFFSRDDFSYCISKSSFHNIKFYGTLSYLRFFGPHDQVSNAIFAR